MKHSLY
jgi:hypothetical protein